MIAELVEIRDFVFGVIDFCHEYRQALILVGIMLLVCLYIIGVYLGWW